MEIIDNNHSNKTAERSNEGRSIFLGVILLVIGVIWLLNNFDVIPHRLFDILISWESLLIVIGGYLISVRNTVSGIVIGGIGLLFVMCNIFGIHVSFEKVILPTILIAAGAGIIISRVTTEGRR